MSAITNVFNAALPHRPETVIKAGDHVRWTEQLWTFGGGTVERTGTVLGVLRDGRRAVIEIPQPDSAITWPTTVAISALEITGCTISVSVSLAATMCQHCDTVFGIPPHLEGHPHYCPYAHRNEPTE